MEEEIWKDVVGYEGLYAVSNMGRIKSLSKMLRTPSTTFLSEERILPPQVSKGGYLRIGLTKDGKQKHHSVHRIVAAAFLGVNKELTVNHKDEDKTNNRVENLEYMTRAENVRYGTGVQRSAKTRRENSYNAIPVNQYTIDGRFVKRYASAVQATRENGGHTCGTSILQSCRRISHTALGYIWRFDGDTDTSFVKGTNARKVAQYDKGGNFIAEYKSLEEAKNVTKTQKGHICSCCRGKRPYANGFIWKYVD